MAASRVANNIAVGFEWTPFSHGFVFWESPKPEHGGVSPNPRFFRHSKLSHLRCLGQRICAPFSSELTANIPKSSASLVCG